MKKSTFLVFTMPSFIMMTLFIALPLLIVLIQSFQFNQDVLETIERENCDPFGCKTETITVPVLDENGNKIKNNIWVGFQNYKNILKFEQLSSVISNDGFEWSKIRSIDFYKALRFTLTFTFITLPLVIILGLILALSVNVLINRLKGPIIFITLLPFIITPVIGALSIKWLFIGDGILTLQLGYSHDIKLAIPNDLEVNCTKPTEISISGIDKQKVGQFASEVRALRKPEPYKGKGVRYSDEVIRRKEGKKK